MYDSAGTICNATSNWSIIQTIKIRVENAVPKSPASFADVGRETV